MAWANSLKINLTPPLYVYISYWFCFSGESWRVQILAGSRPPGQASWAMRHLADVSHRHGLGETCWWRSSSGELSWWVWAPSRALAVHCSLSQETWGVGGSFYFRLKPKGMLERDLATFTAESHADPSPWWFYTCQQGFGGARLSGLGQSGMPWGLDFPWELLMSMKKRGKIALH